MFYIYSSISSFDHTISWFPTLCSGWPLCSSLVICTAIWNSRIKRKPNEMNNCGILGVVCIYSYLAITVMVLHLFQNKYSDGVHTVIGWSMLGFYICFRANCVDTLDTDILLTLCTTCHIPKYWYSKLLGWALIDCNASVN